MQLIKDDPRVKEAAAKRGIDDTSTLQIDPWPTGNMGLDHEEGRRVARGIAFYREEPDHNGYARPVDGIMAFVDLDLMEVYRVDDIGTWPLAAEISNFSAGTVPERTDVKALEITQPDGPSFTITDGNHIHWQNWDVRALMDHTEGLVLHSLAWTEGEHRRPIIRRASLAEMVVPYGEVRETQAFKNALDVGEVALGRCVNSLKLGCDCLGDITYLDATWCFDDGKPVTVEQAICIHEEDFGIAWKHTDSHTGNAEVRRSRRLVISSIFTVGNYDYGIFWYLYVDGTFQMEIKLTGIVTTQSHAEGDDLTYAALVAPEVAAPIHQHLFCARFDMEVDGPNNTVYRVDVEPDPPGPDNPHNNAFRAVATRLDSERQADDVVDASRSRTWRVMNEGARNRLGRPTGYKLLPADTATLFPVRGVPHRRSGRLRHPKPLGHPDLARPAVSGRQPRDPERTRPPGPADLDRGRPGPGRHRPDGLARLRPDPQCPTGGLPGHALRVRPLHLGPVRLLRPQPVPGPPRSRPLPLSAVVPRRPHMSNR